MRVLNVIAKTLSVLLYPLFVPTYGIALFCWMQSFEEQPLHWIWILVAIIGTFIFTCVLPVTAIWVMMKRGQVKDLYIDNPAERTVPYMYSAIGFVFWCWLLIKVLQAPNYLCAVAVGATITIGIVAIINKWWKISAHLAGLGGLIGGIFSYCLGIGAIPTWYALCAWFALSWLLMWARLYLNAHTSTQVCAGWLLGLTCTILPYLLIS